MTAKHQAGPSRAEPGRTKPGRVPLAASVCPDPDCVEGRILFSPEKASATVRIPASTQHTNGLFEDYSNVCLCSPTTTAPPPPPPPASPPPSAPTHRPNLHFGRNEEKGQERRKKSDGVKGREGKGREGRGGAYSSENSWKAIPPSAVLRFKMASARGRPDHSVGIMALRPPA